MSTLLLIALASAVSAAVITGAVRRYALRNSLLDVPNARSSHQVPTPRGGGLAIVIVVSAALAGLAMLDAVGAGSAVSVLVSGLAVATIGWIDDRQSVPALLRIVVHVGAVSLALAGTQHLGLLNVPFVSQAPAVQFAVAAFALVWLLNLFNFMDGIDGIAGVEAVFVATGIAICLRLNDTGNSAATWFAVGLAGASAGFLVWNWPPARIFMGDVGSGFLGFMLGALALVAHRLEGLSLWVPAILLGVFVTDASVTLVRRILRGERWHAAHRLHGYQRLARRFKAQVSVTIACVAINIVWLLPWAALATLRPSQAPLIAAVAYVPLISLALAVGSGRSESH